jgi:arylsulfatase A
MPSSPLHLPPRACPAAATIPVLALAVVVLQTTSTRAQNDISAPRPNVVLMMADDMGLGDTSAYRDFTGNADAVQIHTPNMERLARMGVRFTDAHTPSSRCSPTRYGLLTGRYPWRNRLKHWVLFGVQGDPMIEADRPTIATLLASAGYRTGMVGKWHVGLRYRRSDGRPAAGWDDADLRQPLFDTPLDHGFDFARYTSRSHGTSGPEPGRANNPNQSKGPGHLHGRTAVAATDDGKRLAVRGDGAFVLRELGGRHSDHAAAFLDEHLANEATRAQPFLLYYACNANHTPYTPDSQVGETPVAGAARSVAGEPLNPRGDFVHENDAALGRLLDELERRDDPRRPGSKLIDSTVVIFTSDNGAERDDDVSTGPFRSHKGSVYEGGHRVPFLVAWARGGIGDGNATTPGRTSDVPIGLIDLFATLGELAGVAPSNWRNGAVGGEDSTSVLAAWRAEAISPHALMFHDHKEARDHAASAIRIDDPEVGGRVVRGQWKLFFDAGLLRRGEVHPIELYDLASDPREARNRIDDPSLAELVAHLSAVALLHRTAGGHRLAPLVGAERFVLDWSTDRDANDGGVTRIGLADDFRGHPVGKPLRVSVANGSVNVTVIASGANDATCNTTAEGLGLGGDSRIDNGESLLFTFGRDVLVESAALVAGQGGTCGGFYRVAEHAPQPVYCIDADIDSNDQSGLLSDVGVLKQGQTLRLDSSPHLGVEARGDWRLRDLTFRLLADE